MQKDGRHYTENLRGNYESDGEFNKRVACATSNIDNDGFMSKHTYSIEKFSTELQHAFTILNNNSKSRLENQMVRKILEKIKVPNN